jgi:hypothetical protein
VTTLLLCPERRNRRDKLIMRVVLVLVLVVFVFVLAAAVAALAATDGILMRENYGVVGTYDVRVVSSCNNKKEDEFCRILSAEAAVE